MKFNNLLKKVTGIVSLFSLVLAENDCKEIEKYIKGNEFADEIIENCIENDNGQVTNLTINNYRSSLTQEDINKFSSYKTLKFLEYKYRQNYELLPTSSYDIEVNETKYSGYENNYYVGYDENIDDSEEVSSYCPNVYVPNFNLHELSELTEFKFTQVHYYTPYYTGYGTPSYAKHSIILPDTQFTLPDSLKKLYIHGVYLNQDYVDTINKLPNLEEIHFNSCNYNDVNLESVKIPNITFDEKSGGCGYGQISENVLSQLKNVKNITLHSIDIGNYMLEEIEKLTNLEELNILNCISYYMCGYYDYLHGCASDCEPHLGNIEWNHLYSLSKLSSLNLSGDIIQNEEVIPGIIENMKYLKKLVVDGESYEVEGLEQPEDPEPTKCSKNLKYECCSHCHSIYSDKDGLWGAEHGKWCIIPEQCQKEYENCWSVKYGYPCCDHCKVHSKDKHGSWGIMNKDWCGIPDSC